MATYDAGDQPESWDQWKDSLPHDIASLDKSIYDNVNNWTARQKQYARGKLFMLKAEFESDTPPKKRQKLNSTTSLNSNNNNNTNDTTTTQHTTTNQEHTQHTDTVTTTIQANNNTNNTMDTANNHREPSMSKSRSRSPSMNNIIDDDVDMGDHNNNDNNNNNDNDDNQDHRVAELQFKLNQTNATFNAKFAAMEKKMKEHKNNEFIKAKNKLIANELFKFKETLSGSENMDQLMRYLRKLKDYIHKLERNNQRDDDLIVTQIEASFINEALSKYQTTKPTETITPDILMQWIVLNFVTTQDPRQQLHAQLVKVPTLPGKQLEEITRLLQNYKAKLSEFDQVRTLIASFDIGDVHNEYKIKPAMQAMVLYKALPAVWKTKFDLKWDQIPTTLEDMESKLTILYQTLKANEESQLMYQNTLNKFKLHNQQPFSAQTSNDPTYTGHESTNMVNFMGTNQQSRAPRSYYTQNYQNSDYNRTNSNYNKNNNNNNNNNNSNGVPGDMEKYYFEGYCYYFDDKSRCGYYGHHSKHHTLLKEQHLDIAKIFSHRATYFRLSNADFKAKVPNYKGAPNGRRGGGRGRGRGYRGGGRGRGRGRGYRGRGRYRDNKDKKQNKREQDKQQRRDMNRDAVYFAQHAGLSARNAIKAGHIDPSQLSDKSKAAVFDEIVEHDMTRKTSKDPKHT